MPVAVPIAMVAASAISAVAANKAAGKQGKAADAALEFQKQEAAKKEAADKQRWAAWNASREVLMRRYGIDIPQTPPQATPAVAEATPAARERGPAWIYRPGQTGPAGQPENLKEMMASGPTQENATLPEDLGRWNDWRRYGIGREA